MVDSCRTPPAVTSIILLAAGVAAGDSTLAEVLQTAARDVVVNGDSLTNDTMPSMAVLADGTTWIAWHAYADRRDRVLARRVGADGLGPVHSISRQGAIHDSPILVACGDDGAWVFWAAQRDDRWCVLGRRLDGGQRQPAVVLSDEQTDAMMPAAVSLGDGRLVLAWSAYAGETCVGVQPLGCKADRLKPGLQHRRFQIWSRVLEDGSWKAPVAISPPDHHSYRPALAATSDGVTWIVWDSYQDGNYIVEGRSLIPELGPVERISPAGAYAITPTALATRHGVCVAWLGLEDVIAGAGVVSQMHTLRMAIRGEQGWRLAVDAEGSSVAATLTHGIMVKIEPKPEWKLGYMGRCRVPMLLEADDAVWLLWDRKRNPPGHPALSDGELVGRPWRNGTWDEPVVLHQKLVDYHVATNPTVHNNKFFFLASQLPRQRRRIYHRVVGDLTVHTPFRQDEWIGWRPVKLPLPEEHSRRHEIMLADKTYRLFWADLHNHSTFTCDAEGELDELLHYARDRARLHVVTMTANDDIFDDPLTEAEYARTTFLARCITREGGLLALPGYEWTAHLPRSKDIAPDDPRGYDFLLRGKLGYANNHRSVIYPLSGGPLLRHTEVRNDIRHLQAAVEAAGGVALPQHTYWTPTHHSTEPCAEVTSAWGIYIEQSRGRFHQLLNQGYRYGFMGLSDSHRRNPGLGGALTGIYAEDLTDKSILDAIRERRVFATNGSRIILDSRAGDAFMGTEVRSPDGSITITLNVTGTKPLVDVTLIRDGKEVKTFDGDGKRRLRLVFKDEALPKGTHWYYWRVAQEGQSPLYRGNAKAARGHLAWSSPHWVIAE